MADTPETEGMGQGDSSSESTEEIAGFEPQEEGAKKTRKKVRRPDNGLSLNITSMMDMFTIILVFLLKSYSADPVKITPGDDMKLPVSTALLTVEEAVPIVITKRGILVNDKPVVSVENGKADASAKQGGESGYLITPVLDALSDEREKQKTIAKYNAAQTFRGMAIVVADEKTPYRLITEILYTAGQAEFANFKFAVVKGRG